MAGLAGKENTRAPLADRGDDLYETPPVATEALLRAEKLPQRIWEPACGPGAIVRVLRGAGHDVLASDLVDYGGVSQFAGRDFLMETRLPPTIEAIVTNPPFKLAGKFVLHAFDLGCPKIIMLLRLQFLEGVTRGKVIDGGTLARVLVFRNRLPRMHRDGWTGPLATSRLAFAWFVWDRSHSGRPTELRRISWEKPVADRKDNGENPDPGPLFT